MYLYESTKETAGRSQARIDGSRDIQKTPLHDVCRRIYERMDWQSRVQEMPGYVRLEARGLNTEHMIQTRRHA